MSGNINVDRAHTRYQHIFRAKGRETCREMIVKYDLQHEMNLVTLPLIHTVIKVKQ